MTSRVAWLVAVALTACDTLTEPPPIAMVTSESNYELQRVDNRMSVQIPLTITNPFAHDIYIESCANQMPLVLSKQTGTRWTHVISGLGSALCFGVLKLAPGESINHTMHIGAADRGTTDHPQFATDTIDGLYRVEMFAFRSYDEKTENLSRPIPSGDLRSNTFTLDEIDVAETTCLGGYPYGQLLAWHHLARAMYVAGTTSYGFDETKQCLHFGIERNAVLPGLEARMRAVNIPRAAYYVRVEPSAELR